MQQFLESKGPIRFYLVGLDELDGGLETQETLLEDLSELAKLGLNTVISSRPYPYSRRHYAHVIEIASENDSDIRLYIDRRLKLDGTSLTNAEVHDVKERLVREQLESRPWSAVETL
jgi:hypothetical protein